MFNKRITLILIILSISQATIADPLTHNNIAILYSEGGDNLLDVKGLGIEGEHLVANHVLLGGFLGYATDKSGLPPDFSLDGTVIGFSAAGIINLSNTTQVYAGAEISRAKTDLDTPSGSSNNEETQKDIIIGAIYSNSDSYELRFDVDRDIGETNNETTFFLTGRYFLNNTTSLGLSYGLSASDDDYSETQISLKYDL